MNQEMKQIGLRIRDLRKEKGLNQTELANSMGKSLRTIQKYENGEIELSIANINDLANMLNTTSTYLLGYKTDTTQINCLADVMDFLFKLEQKEGVNFSIDVKKPKTDGSWKCSVTFDGQDGSADMNSSICLFLEEYENYREKLKEYWISQDAYEDWQDKTMAYYSATSLVDKKEETLDEDTRLRKRNELMKKLYPPTTTE